MRGITEHRSASPSRSPSPSPSPSPHREGIRALSLLVAEVNGLIQRIYGQDPSLVIRINNSE